MPEDTCKTDLKSRDWRSPFDDYIDMCRQLDISLRLLFPGDAAVMVKFRRKLANNLLLLSKQIGCVGLNKEDIEHACKI